MSRDVGDRIALRHEVRDADGTLTAATASVVVTKPDGTTTSPTVSTPSTGIYDAAFVVDAVGSWSWKWTVSGTLTDVAYGQVDVADPAPSTYASLAQLKAGIKITAADRDELLMSALSTAARWVDSYTGRRPGGFALAPAATARTYNPRGRLTHDAMLMVDEIGSTTGLVVESGTSAAWTGITDYESYPDNALALSTPITRLHRPIVGWLLFTPWERIRVTARWGWPYVPEQVKQATLIQARRIYRRKDSPEGIAGQGEFGVVRLPRMDPDVRDLLAPYALPGFA